MPPWLSDFLKGAAAAIGLGALFSWFDVYDTGGMAPWMRMLMWSTTMAVGIWSAALVTPWIFERRLRHLHWMLQVLIAASIIALPVTVALLTVMSIDAGLIPVRYWPQQYIYVLTVAIILTAGGYGLDRLREQSAASKAGAAGTKPPAAPPFVDRLPARLRTAEIHAVSAEDHYLRVHTSAGQELILMRLADAIRELAGVDGLQTHRSWWVAKAGVAETAQANGRVALKLKSGVEAPVSRTFVQSVRDAGWI
ncbi:MAG: LytTR family DNA-binding domain-containing protein [Alphaproteobacteria bacterium]|nr:LytTR family DNA-binding domain-containing protein [Alphaproteobacteria bacterium]